MGVAAGNQAAATVGVVDPIEQHRPTVALAGLEHAQRAVLAARRTAGGVVLALGGAQGEEGQQRLLAQLEEEIADQRLGLGDIQQAEARLLGIEAEHPARYLEEFGDLVVDAQADLAGQLLWNCSAADSAAW